MITLLIECEYMNKEGKRVSFCSKIKCLKKHVGKKVAEERKHISNMGGKIIEDTFKITEE